MTPVARAPLGYRLVSAAQTDPGKRTEGGRPHNEDVARFWDEIGLYVVADGIGGAAAGEVASELTVTYLERALAVLRDQSVMLTERRRQLLEQGVKAASRAVWDRAQSRELKHMGSTVVGALFCPPPRGSTEAHWALAHLGDSRAYLLTASGFRPLTSDHNAHGLLTRSVGGAEDVEVPCTLWATVPGDKLLLCTDGLSDCVDAGEMVRCLRYAPDLAARRLVDAALAHQAQDARFQDNITALVVEVRRG